MSKQRHDSDPPLCQFGQGDFMRKVYPADLPDVEDGRPFLPAWLVYLCWLAAGIAIGASMMGGA